MLPVVVALMISKITYSPAQVVAAAGGSGLLFKRYPINTAFNRGDYMTLELDITTSGVAPGAGKEVTAYVAFASDKEITDEDVLRTCATALVCAIPNTSNTRRIFVMPLQYIGAEACYVWLDSPALAVGASLSVGINVNAKRS